MNRTSLVIHAKELAAAASAALLCYAATAWTGAGLLGDFFPAGMSPQLSGLFEQHIWQFLIAFTAIGYLSRGHLWSYGINSNNLKRSMQWLGALYAGTVVVWAVSSIVGGGGMHAVPKDFAERPDDAAFMMLISWMSSPVANQILFFGFAQTVVAKTVRSGNSAAAMPLVILFSSLLFTALATGIPRGNDPQSTVLTFVLALYCGVVYWKTGSLITPMLGQAFFFGFPVVVSLLQRMFA